MTSHITRFICRHWYGWTCTESKLAITRDRIREAVLIFIMLPLAGLLGFGLAALITYLTFCL